MPLTGPSTPSVPFKFARIDASASGDTTVVAAVAGKKIRALGFLATSDAGGAGIDVRFKSGATVLAGPLFVDKGVVLSYAGSVAGPAFETAAGEALVINLSAAKQVQGHLAYLEVF